MIDTLLVLFIYIFLRLSVDPLEVRRARDLFTLHSNLVLVLEELFVSAESSCDNLILDASL